MVEHTDIYTQKIVNLLIRRRKELGISQIQLAERTGLPQSTIARVEKHKLHLRLDTLMKILTVLNLDISLFNNEKLETKRLILRKLTINDAEAMFNGWCNDSEVTKYMTWNPHKNMDETKSILSTWIKEYDNPDTIRYGICLKNSGKLIGSIDVVTYINGNPVIGFCLSKEYWNNGYMTEACQRLIQYLFNLGFKKIIIGAVDKNIGSNRVIEKCGFIFTHKENKDHFSTFKEEPVTLNWYELSY